ncbi:MAG TPA: endo-1,4-beta-xylanase [Vicinamibacteria bacterium]|nr:endo-1,4-beta-xylanase [Vicinamibacteria bacterium]
MPHAIRLFVAACLSVPGLAAVSFGAPLRDSASARGLYIGAAAAMGPLRNEPVYAETLRREFNMVVAENAFKMDALRPSATTFNFTDADALVAFAEANGMAVRGHTLVWHSQLPGWLTSGNFTRDQVIAIMRDHIMTVMGRYRGRIVHWDVVNEAMADGTGQLRTSSFWHQRIGPEYIALAFQFAREADPNAVLYYNDYEAEGLGQKSDAVFNLVSSLRNQGVPIDGVGWQTHKINPFRIQAQHVTNAQRLAALGVEISITEMDVRIALPADATELQQQALAYEDAVRFCLEQPNCTSLVIWGFTDKYSWVPSVFSGFGDALIFNASYQPKPAYTALQAVLEQGAPQPPAPPTGLTATAGNAQVALTWSASSGATSYNVKRATTSGGPYATVGSTAGTSFTSTGLTNGTTYFFVVSAVNGAGESTSSAQASATPQAAGFTLQASPASLTINRGSSGTSTIAIARTSFPNSVALAATGLPGGVTAAFNPSSTTGNSSVLTMTASATATLGPVTVTVTGTGGGLTRTTTVALTVAAPSSGNVTVTRAVTSNSPWFTEEQVRITNTVSLTALSVTIVVQRTTGVSASGQYNTVGGQIQQSSSSTASAITYQFALASGQTLGTGTNRTFAAQMGGTGTLHPTSGDTWSVTYTSGGQTVTQSGTF